MKIVNLLFFILILSGFGVFAQLKTGDNVVITDKSDQDLYIAGGTVTINAPIQGDLIAAGGTIFSNDTVAMDVMMVGGEITFNGYVADDIRCAGGKIKISSNVGGDLVVTGGTITIEKDAVIDGNLFVSGGEVLLNGEVKGLIKNASGTFTLNGRAGNDIDCRGGKLIINGTVAGSSILAANEIEIGTQAHFNKDVRYWNEDEKLDFKNSLTNNKADFDSSLELQNARWHYLGFASMLMALWYLGMALVMILLVEYLFSVTMKNAADIVKNTSLKSLGLGFLYFLGMPVIMVVAVITIIGLPIGMILLLLYITLLLLATVIVSILIANWINNTYYGSSWKLRKIVFAAFGIFVLLKFISLTPFVGPLIMFLLVCMGFGGILQSIKWKRNKDIILT